MVRLGNTAALPGVLRSLGMDPGEVLGEIGFAVSLFEDPNTQVSYADRGRMLAHSVARSGCRHLGLLVGQQAGLQSLGLVGLLVKYSPDVETALNNLTRFMHLYVRGATVTLTVDARSATLSYVIYDTDAEGSDQVGDGANAAMFNVLQSLCGPHWHPSEVQFAHLEPADITPHRQFFQSRLFFDAAQYAVVFPAEWLLRSLPNTDPDVLVLIQREVSKLESELEDDLPERVRRVLSATVLTGHIGCDEVAAMFSMHSRTFNRRLGEFDTNFEKLLSEVRYETARHLLRDSGMDVSQVAYTVGYSDASAFTRAFRRWSGTTPARWRARNRSGS